MNRRSEQDALLEQWIAEYRAIPFKLARGYARSSSAVDDLYGEMLFQIWRSTAQFAGNAKPSTWIYRVCLNTALTWRRTHLRHETHLDHAVDINHLESASSSPAQSAIEQDRVEKLYSAIQTMSDLDRALILLWLDDLSYKEIAEITGLSPNHVGVAVSRVRQKLVQLLKPYHNELR